MAFLDRWFGRNKTKDEAKERLQLVLIHDRTDLAPELLEQLRTELIKVICNYLEVDDKKIELGLEREDRTVASWLIYLSKISKGTFLTQRTSKDK